MPTVTIEGSWYGSGCGIFSGVYSDLGEKSHTNFSIIQTGIGACGGYSFQVLDNTTNTIIYTSTSPAQNVALYFDGEPPAPSYDCINGACLPQGTYDTPGLYESLEECQTACGTGCSGKCISNSDWTQIEGLANKLKQKNCS
jgi:hypothetical protein